MYPSTPQVLLTAYATHLRATGAAPRTIRLRLLHATAITQLAPSLELITTGDLEAWMHPAHRHYSAETMKSRRSSARRFFTWLHENGHVAADVASRLYPVHVIPAPPRVIPDTDMRLALGHVTTRDRAAILLARYACLRLTEIATLRTTDRTGDALRVTGKGGRIRIVYMHPDLRHALDALEQQLDDPRGWYFPGLGTASHMHPDSMHKIIKRVTGWNPHALRHAGATAAYRATKDLRAVQLMLGHASLATTQRYLSLDEEALRAVATGVALAA
ncbi:hypothetical protein L332_03710 [Agrococcus pavilionensis RW1]|uniref:Integrase n=1 Tax=Agrococcus pavilionensis RW1 TaxID=1330458 RepID=U1LNK9_9MICO|nr:tyrosine-type recombinase/integrase [Agrococcus pavilionensis]ERG63557.1 hypothetical protein L332_03710 [Agrococcus pavilionensis RW1]